MKDSLVRSAPAPGAHALQNLSKLTDVAPLVLGLTILGGVVGVVWAVYLRRRGWAWTAGLLGLAPLGISTAALVVGVLRARDAAALIGFSLGLSAGALGWGIYLRVQDRRAGGDREIMVAERRGLLDVLRRMWSERPSGRRMLRDGVPVGRTIRGELAMVGRGSDQSGRHVLIPGATGAGKTTSLAALLVDYVARSGFGAVVLEAKTDRGLREAAEMAAFKRGVPFYLFSPTGPNGYDPLAHGSVDERSERLIAVESWGSGDADFYRQAASPFLRLVLRVLDSTPEPVTLTSVASHCDPDELENLALSSENSKVVGEIAAAAAAGLRTDQLRAIAGLRARLENLASSDFAQSWLDPTREGTPMFDLRDVIKQRGVAYFRFDTDRTGNVGRAIAQMVLLDLGAAASAWMGEGAGTFVAIDEFGALEAPALDRLFARGRAAGFSVAVGTQTLADLRAAGPAVRERIGATVSGIVCHRIGEQGDAEWVAELIGAVPTWQSTIRTDWLGWPTSHGTRTRGYRFEVNPSQLQRLRAGEAYVAQLDRSASRRAARVRVVPAWERLATSGSTGWASNGT